MKAFPQADHREYIQLPPVDTSSARILRRKTLRCTIDDVLGGVDFVHAAPALTVPTLGSLRLPRPRRPRPLSISRSATQRDTSPVTPAISLSSPQGRSPGLYFTSTVISPRASRFPRSLSLSPTPSATTGALTAHAATSRKSTGGFAFDEELPPVVHSSRVLQQPSYLSVPFVQPRGKDQIESSNGVREEEESVSTTSPRELLRDDLDLASVSCAARDCAPSPTSRTEAAPTCDDPASNSTCHDVVSLAVDSRRPEADLESKAKVADASSNGQPGRARSPSSTQVLDECKEIMTALDQEKPQETIELSAGGGDRPERTISTGPTRKTEAPATENWFPFSTLTETNGKVVGQHLVRQLPKPETAEAERERGKEWETRVDRTEQEIVRAYEALKRINRDELGLHHHVFPSLDVFKAHVPHLPKWLLDGERAKWRSPTDEWILDNPGSKLFRYIYLWRYVLPLDEAEAFVAEAGERKWSKLATKRGCKTSYKMMIAGLRKAINKAGIRKEETVDAFGYTGMGAKSELQVNASCRSFAHLDNPPSLFGLALEIISSFELRNPDTRGRLVQTFVLHLPLDVFHYSARIFMFAESIVAVGTRSAPPLGGANVLSCGDVNLAAAFNAMLSSVTDDSRLATSLIGTCPVSVSNLLIDRSIRFSLETIGDLKRRIELVANSEGKGTERATTATESKEAARSRLEAIKTQESNLRKTETLDLGTTSIVPDTGRYLPRVPGPARSSRLPVLRKANPPSPAPSNPTGSKPRRDGRREASTKDPQLARVSAKYKIDTSKANDLDSILFSLPYSSSHLLSALLPYGDRLSVKRSVVALLLHRSESGSGPHSRAFDNFFDTATLSSPNGVTFKANVGNKVAAVSKQLTITGVGVALGTDDAIEISHVLLALLDIGTVELRLKWSAEKRTLVLLTASGEPVEVLKKGGRGKTTRAIRWDENELCGTASLGGFAQVLGLNLP